MKSLIIISLAVLISIQCLGQDIKLEAESAVTTTHEVTIKGQKISYMATAGTQPVWNQDGKVIASLFYTYYERNGINDRSTRPLVISL